MVYGKFFRKPFSKTRVLLPLKSRLSTQSLLSLFLALDFADLVTGLRGGLRDEASPIWGFAAKRGFADLGLRDEASSIWGSQPWPTASRNREPPRAGLSLAPWRSHRRRAEDLKPWPTASRKPWRTSIWRSRDPPPLRRAWSQLFLFFSILFVFFFFFFFLVNDLWL